MVNRFPLLDGSEINLDHQIDAHPNVDHTRTILLRQDFAQESLDWWETYQTDNGPTTPSFSGLATSDGMTDVQLDTGAEASGDTTQLIGPTVNWNNWTEVRTYVWGATANRTPARLALTLADAGTETDISEGFRFQIYEDQNIAGRVWTGGSSQNWYSESTSALSENNFGFRIYENPTGSGHNVDWVFKGHHGESWNESAGFPNATDLQFRLAVTTNDGNSTVGSFDGWLIELIR